MTLETGGYYPRTISSSDVGDGITELKYKDIFAFDDTHAMLIKSLEGSNNKFSLPD